MLPPKTVARYRHVCPRQTPLQSRVHCVARKSRSLSISDRLYHRRFIQHLDSALDTLVQQCNALSLNDDIAWRHAYAVYLMPLNRPCACTRICTRSDVRRPVPRRVSNAGQLHGTDTTAKQSNVRWGLLSTLQRQQKRRMQLYVPRAILPAPFHDISNASKYNPNLARRISHLEKVQPVSPF